MLKKICLATTIGVMSIAGVGNVGESSNTVANAVSYSHKVLFNSLPKGYYERQSAINKKAKGSKFSIYMYKGGLDFGKKKILLKNGYVLSAKTKKRLTLSSSKIGTANVKFSKGYIVHNGKRYTGVLSIAKKGSSSYDKYYVKSGKVFTFNVN